MNSIFGNLITIAHVFFRDNISRKEKITLLTQYYVASLRRKLFSPTSINFLGYTIFSRAYDNLHGIIREVFLYGDYAVTLKNSTPIIIDCGGNIGVSTLYFKHLYPKSRITVFEPSTANFEVLQKNVEFNGLKDVQLVNAATGKEKGTMRFWDNAKKPGSSTSVEGVFETKIKQNFVEVTVQSVKLSDYITGKVDLLKMDIEGGEGVVIEELEKSGKLSLIQEMVFEYHHNKQNPENELLKLLTTLEKHKFQYVIFGNEFALSSEKLKALNGYHFMVRAYQSNV